MQLRYKDEIQTIHSLEHKNEALFIYLYFEMGKFGLDIHTDNFVVHTVVLVFNKDFENSLKNTIKTIRKKFSFLNYKL